jgi:quercetin dioxygenase-like cupin family protein
MKSSISYMLAVAFISLAAPVVHSEGVKGVEVTPLFSSDKAKGSMVTIQPGAVMPSVARPGARAGYVVRGGLLERKYEDGKTKSVPLKTGQTLYLDKPEDQAAYSITNKGSNAVKIYVVNIK